MRLIALHPVHELACQALKDFVGGVFKALRQHGYALGNAAASLAGDGILSRIIVTCVGSRTVKKSSHVCLLLIRRLNKHRLVRIGLQVCAVDHKGEGEPHEVSGFVFTVAF